MKTECPAIFHFIKRPALPPFLAMAVTWTIVLVQPVGPPSFCRAQDKERNTALTAIFRRTVLQDNLRAIHRRTVVMTPEDRFDWLLEWVLPQTTDQQMLFCGWFTVLNPEPRQRSDDSLAAANALLADERGLNRVLVGGNLKSPVLDLVEAGRQTGRLDELKRAVLQIPASDNHAQRCRCAMLVLIELNLGQYTQAQQYLEQLYGLVRQAEEGLFDRHWPETIAASAAIGIPQFHGLIRDMLGLLQVHVNHRGSEVWASHVKALLGQASVPQSKLADLRTVTNDVRETHDSVLNTDADSSLTHWHPVSRLDAKTRGLGRPKVRWHVQAAEVRNVANHGVDHLYFQSPLLGNYEIECEVASGDYAAGHLLVAGRWHSLASRSELEHGGFRSTLPRLKIEPEFSGLDNWSRYRVVVRADVQTVYINGRQVAQQTLPQGHDPWLAIRSIWDHNCAVRNLRITGSPDIPDKVWLLTDPLFGNWKTARLDNWKAPSRDEYWWLHWPEPEHGGIVGRRVKELPGESHAEALNFYHRPLLEDGAIEYEFYYEPGEFEVHPAMDRMVFLLRPDAVRLHWLTDGVFDPTDADPAAEFTEQPHAGLLPFKLGQWNRLQLQLTGDVVNLYLNGEAIFSRQLEATNQRVFGLFHYADQTEARVRNAAWVGNWPKVLPDTQQQELVAADHACLDNVDQLHEEIYQKFSDQPLPADLFEIEGTALDRIVRMEVDGLRLLPFVRGQVRGVRVKLLRPIHGDFDITLRFADLNFQTPSASNIGLVLAAFEEGSGIMAGVSRTIDFRRRIKANAKSTIPLPDGRYRYESEDLVDESDAGTLRLVRTGTECHALIAHGDSDNFRFIGTQKFKSSTSPVTIQVRAFASNNGSTTVLFKDLTIRSNSQAIENSKDPRVQQLDQYTLALPRKYGNDLADSNHQDLLSDGGAIQFSAEGARMVVTGAGTDADAAESVVRLRKRIVGDFDVSVAVDVKQLAWSRSSGEPGVPQSSVELFVPISESGDSAALRVSRNSDGSLVVRALVSTDNSPYRLVAEANRVALIENLRLIRIQKTMFFVYTDGQAVRLLESAFIDDGPIQSDALAIRSTAVAADDVDVVWSSLKIQARSFDR